MNYTICQNIKNATKVLLILYGCATCTKKGRKTVKRQSCSKKREKVIHIKKALKSDKSDLCTKLYTLSTDIYVNPGQNFMVTEGTNVL